MKKINYPELSKMLLNIVIYLVFLIYMINLIITTPQAGTKFLYLFILVVFLGFAVWYEVLKQLYRKALTLLLFDCDPEKSFNTFNQLIKMDLFKSYRMAQLVYLTLYYTDTYQMEKLKQLLDEHDKEFRSSLELLLVADYNSYTYYRVTGNKTQMKRIYPKLIELRDVKIKKKSIAPYYNWDYVSGTYSLAVNDLKKARTYLEHVDLINSNKREKCHYYISMHELALRENRPDEMVKWRKLLLAEGNLMNYANYLAIQTGGFTYEKTQDDR